MKYDELISEIMPHVREKPKLENGEPMRFIIRRDNGSWCVDYLTPTLTKAQVWVYDAVPILLADIDIDEEKAQEVLEFLKFNVEIEVESVTRRLSDEQVLQANSADLVEYAKANGFEVKKQGKDYEVAGHGGLIIDADRRKWYSFANSEGGGPVQFAMKILNKNFVDAVKDLTAHCPQATAERIIEANKHLILPEKVNNNTRLFEYLCDKRGIDEEMVQFFVDSGQLYQDVNGNCVFITHEDDKPVYAFRRSMYSDFRGDVTGSRKVGWGWDDDAETVCVFESPIDLMSYMQLDDGTAKKNYLSVGGTTIAPLLRYLERNPTVRHVVICTDNDPAGEKFYTDNSPKLAAIGLLVTRDRPDGKDWNEDVVVASERESELEL
ncbi:hypothetical protein FACS18949_02220 [Clostridia bacterium]|nr:hypothetical protein FACS18949_02220 [Clostridia bacterium]